MALVKALSPDSSNKAATGRAARRTAGRSAHLARTRAAVIASVVALGIGGGIAGTALATVMQNPDSTAAGPVNKLAPQVNPRTLTGEAFALAAAGDCLNWRGSDQGLPTDIYAVDCAEPHRFEVADRLDLTNKTANDAHPRGSANVELARELCAPVVDTYTADHPLDPDGRFAVALIPPSQEGWEAGDRSALCGVAAKELNGSSAESTGRFFEADQHRLWEPGQCLGINDQRVPTSPVDCAEDHSIEIAATISIADVFPDGDARPEPARQTELSARACYDAAVEYLGDAEALRRTTLFAALVQPISQVSWQTGSRTINCGLMRTADPGPFAVLQGSAKTGVRIEGEDPQVPTTTVIPSPSIAQPAQDNPSAPAQVPVAPPANGGNTAGGGNGGNGGVANNPGPVSAADDNPAPDAPPAGPAPAPPIPGIDLGGLFPGNPAP